MANSYSSQDLVKGILQRCGERTDGQSPYHGLALKYLNRAYSDLLKGNSLFAPENREVWSWARQTSSFLLPAFQTGTAVLTNGSINATFQVAPTISLAGYNFQITNPTNEQMQSWYTIASHTANSTAFTLDFPYVETSATQSFNACPLTVTIPLGILRLADPLRQYNTRVLEFGELPQDMGRIYYIEYNKFWEMYPLELVLNDIPSKFTIQNYSETTMVLRFNKYVSNNIRIDFDYISTQPLLVDSSTSIPLVPFEDRDVLEMMASYFLMTDKKQPTDAQNYFTMSGQKINAMKMANQGQQKLGKMFGQITPRLDDTAIPYWLIQQR
jgi:hypothetical protein